MKKQVKYLLVGAAALLILALIILNRHSMEGQQELAASKQLSLLIDGQETLYNCREDSADFTTFSTQMKRKNGEVTDKKYGGIELWTILADLLPNPDGTYSVSVVCADQYEVVLTTDELRIPGNIYLVTQENGQPLPSDSGTFMLVITQDEFSTRWAKNIVQVKILEE